jgi:hypothetical protein
MFRGSSLAKDKVAIPAKSFCSMDRQPGELLLGEALQSFDGAQGGNDICDALGLFRVFEFRFHLIRH